MSAPDPRAELVRYYRLLREHGLNDSHSGNASVRDGETVWITPSGGCADTLEPRQLVRATLDGGAAPGASLDAPLHLAVYRRNPAARAVLHSHGPHAVALSLEGGDLVPVDFEGRHYFPRIPVLDAPYADYLARSPELVSAALAAGPVCIYRGHGVYAWGETLDAAYKRSSTVEACARVAWLARVAGIEAPR